MLYFISPLPFFEGPIYLPPPRSLSQPPSTPTSSALYFTHMPLALIPSICSAMCSIGSLQEASFYSSWDQVSAKQTALQVDSTNEWRGDSIYSKHFAFIPTLPRSQNNNNERVSLSAGAVYSLLRISVFCRHIINFTVDPHYLGFHICVFVYSLKYVWNNKINTHGTCTVIPELGQGWKFWVTQWTRPQLRLNRGCSAFLSQLSYCKKCPFLSPSIAVVLHLCASLGDFVV